jgi:geranylgeranyl transferase type-2 subunit beta
MTPPGYLDLLDEMLRPGIAGLSDRFVASQVGFVTACQQADGGFRGRLGGSDEYYTDFALRTLAWLAPDHAAFGSAADYVVRRTSTPRNVIECFNLLNSRRLIERHFAMTAGRVLPVVDPLPFTEWLYVHLLPSGGFARFASDEQVSAYHTFLGALCFQMLGNEIPASEDAVLAVEGLRREDGGYAELAGKAESQTSATAAAVGFLLMHDALSPDHATQTAQFLAAMQADDGGLKPHAAAQGGDLLSTFTGLVTLWGLGGLQPIDVAAVARFLRNLAQAGGGFLACYGDETPDVEYTHYGVGILALLRLWNTAQK